MKKFMFVFFLAFAFLSCQDSRMQAIESKYPSGDAEDKIAPSNNEMVFSDHVKVQNGTLHFNSKESFDKLTNYVLGSSTGREDFLTYLERMGVDNIYYFYTNFPDEKLEEISRKREIPDEYQSYFVFTGEGEDLTLENNIQSTFLRLYFNKELEFYIGKDQVKMEEAKLYLITENEKLELKDDSETSGNVKARATGDYVQYRYGGRDYRLKVESDTRWGSVSLLHGGAYRKFWNYVEYWAHHRRRPWGIWIAQNTSEVWVEGSHYWSNPSTGNYEYVTWNPGKLYDTNEAAWYGYYVHSYTYTGHCKGLDGTYYYKTISETKY